MHELIARLSITLKDGLLKYGFVLNAQLYISFNSPQKLQMRYIIGRIDLLITKTTLSVLKYTGNPRKWMLQVVLPSGSTNRSTKALRSSVTAEYHRHFHCYDFLFSSCSSFALSNCTSLHCFMQQMYYGNVRLNEQLRGYRKTQISLSKTVLRAGLWFNSVKRYRQHF